MGSGADGDYHETTSERRERMRNEFKLGGTYRHYKTKGLYQALAVVQYRPKRYREVVTEVATVKDTGDGRNDRLVRLCLSLDTGRLFVLNIEGAEEQMALYFSFSASALFVRPLTEFVANVAVDGKTDPRFAPRFELLSS